MSGAGPLSRSEQAALEFQRKHDAFRAAMRAEGRVLYEDDDSIFVRADDSARKACPCGEDHRPVGHDHGDGDLCTESCPGYSTSGASK